MEWRNDLKTRQASHNTDAVSRDDHISWLAKSLNNHNRRIYIAEDNNIPVGTVRSDFDENDSYWELSWTTAPQFRGQKVAQRMVAELVQDLNSKVKAEIKTDNIGSIKVANKVGLQLDYEKDGILFYKNPL